MKRIRVAPHGLSRLLYDIVCQVVSRHEDLDLIVEAMQVEVLERLVRERRIEVAVLPAEGSELSPLGWRLLGCWPGLRIVEMAANGSRATRYDLRFHITRITDVSPDSLLCAIRAPARAPEVVDG